MNCNDFQLQLEQKGENQPLTPEAKQHLTGCRECSLLFRDLDRLWDLLDTWKGIEPTPSFQQRFWSQVYKTYSPWNWLSWLHPDFWFRVWRPALASSLVITLLMTGSFLAIRYGFQSPSSPPVLSQNQNDDMLLERLDRTFSPRELIETMDAYDAWSVTGEETPAMNPKEDPAPPSDTDKRSTLLRQGRNRA